MADLRYPLDRWVTYKSPNIRKEFPIAMLETLLKSCRNLRKFFRETPPELYFYFEINEYYESEDLTDIRFSYKLYQRDKVLAIVTLIVTEGIIITNIDDRKVHFEREETLAQVIVDIFTKAEEEYIKNL